MAGTKYSAAQLAKPSSQLVYSALKSFLSNQTGRPTSEIKATQELVKDLLYTAEGLRNMSAPLNNWLANSGIQLKTWLTNNDTGTCKQVRDLYNKIKSRL